MKSASFIVLCICLLLLLVLAASAANSGVLPASAPRASGAEEATNSQDHEGSPSVLASSDDGDRTELAERRLADAVRARVERELVRRYSWIGLVAVFVTGGFLTMAVKSMLADARVRLGAAEEVEIMMTRRLSSATAATDALVLSTERAVQRFEETEADVASRLASLADEADALRRKLSEETGSTLQLSDDLRREISALVTVVQDVAESRKRSSEDAADLKGRLRDITDSLSQSGSGIRRATKRAELLKYDVNVRDLRKASDLIRALEDRGFSVARMAVGARESDSTFDFNTLLIGKSIPSLIVAELVSAAREWMPELKHIAYGVDHPMTFVAGFGTPAEQVKRVVSDEEFRDLQELAGSPDGFDKRLRELSSFYA